MQTLQTTSLRVSENQLFILDQQALPQEKRWLAADNVALLVDHIHALRVRGAPLIGPVRQPAAGPAGPARPEPG